MITRVLTQYRHLAAKLHARALALPPILALLWAGLPGAALAVEGAKPAAPLPPYAATTQAPRLGGWQGGPPPINKARARTAVYYQIKPGPTPDTVIVRIRLEEVTADDATIDFKPIDGARLQPAKQRTLYRLKPGTASQLTLTLALPEQDSLLAVYTHQHGFSAARAILLQRQAASVEKP